MSECVGERVWCASASVVNNFVKSFFLYFRYIN